MLRYLHTGLALHALIATALPFGSEDKAYESLFDVRSTSTGDCRCIPGDACWPQDSEWSSFNESINGKLIATIPVASPCHDSSFGSFDAQRCANLQSTWFFPETHFDTPSSIMAPFFTNNSCNPFLPRNTACTLGNYISYAVNATNADDFQKTIAFVKKHNIRLTVRNTGHDYNGKATGAGAVGIWTHNMKSTEVVNYRSAHYTGRALKMGAGIQAVEAYKAAYDQGLVVVGGNCPTVGIAGGYTQGGGHGPLASKFGLGADQALEWEVVTGTGELLVATPTQNADLYWALSGGGGGTYGVVSSLTVKAHPDLRTSAANLTFSSVGISQDTFWDIVQVFQQTLPSIVDTGTVAIWFITNESFFLMPVHGPGVPKDQLQQLLSPTLAKLDQEQIKYDFLIGEFPTYYQSYMQYDPPWNVSQDQIGGRLIPRSLVQQNGSALVQAQRKIIDTGAVMSGVAINVSQAVSSPDANAVNPYWRTALFDMVIGTPYSYTNASSNVAYQQQMTNELLPLIESLTPNGGAYINEANFQQPDFQQVFYGSHYSRLRAIKGKYDPDCIFYALTAVGSEDWYEDQSRGGRLCRAL